MALKNRFQWKDEDTFGVCDDMIFYIHSVYYLFIDQIILSKVNFNEQYHNQGYLQVDCGHWNPESNPEPVPVPRPS